MKTLCKCLVLAALAMLLVPAAARAQFGYFGGYGGYSGGGYGGYNGVGLAGYGAWNGFGGSAYGYGMNSFGMNSFGYGSPYGGYGYGAGYTPYYSATLIVPVISTASTATAPARMRSAIYPAIAYRATAEASIDVRVPAADAEVWIDGVSMKQTGIDRRYITPALDPGSTYTMEIRACWPCATGKRETRIQRIHVRAGCQQSVAFVP